MFASKAINNIFKSYFWMKWPIGIEEQNYKKPFVDFLAFKVNHSNRCYNSYSLIVPLAQKLFFPFLATSIPRPLHSARTFRNVVFCFWCKQLWGFFSDFSPFCGLTSTSTLWKKEISRANILTFGKSLSTPLTREDANSILLSWLKSVYQITDQFTSAHHFR